MDTHKKLGKLKWDILKRKTTNDKMHQTEVPHMDNQNKKIENKVFTTQNHVSAQCLCCREKVTRDKSFKVQYKEHITGRRNTAD